MDAEIAREVFSGAALGAIADHQQVGGRVPHDFGQDAHTILHALDGPEIRHVDQELAIRWGIAAGRGLLVVRLIEVAVYEVGDDPNVVAHAEDLDGLAAQVFADGSDAVGLLDGVLGDGEIGTVGADQGDVGAVQRGDEGQVAAARGILPGLQHLARQQGGERVGDGVVDVEQVE